MRIFFANLNSFFVYVKIFTGSRITTYGGILMDKFYIIAGVILFVAIAYFSYKIGKAIWSCFDHAKAAPQAELSDDAAISDVATKKVRYIGMKFKTTVSFSDGFTFISHKTEKEDESGAYQITAATDKIVEKAKKAHKRALKKQVKDKKRAARKALKEQEEREEQEKLQQQNAAEETQEAQD